MRTRVLIATLALLTAAVLAPRPGPVSAATCQPVATSLGAFTAAVVNPGALTGTVDATGCDIAVYFGPGGPGASNGSVTGADVFGALWYGVFVETSAVDITSSAVHDIGDTPFNGVQRGLAVIYTDGATGSVDGNAVYDYQKNGITIRMSSAVTVTNNTVTGFGPVDFIAQNGVQVSSGSTAIIQGNTITGHDYTPKSYVACGILYFDADGVRTNRNKTVDNEINKCNFGGKNGGQYNPA